MSNVPERLRYWTECLDCADVPLCEEAAGEIERITAENDRIRVWLELATYPENGEHTEVVEYAREILRRLNLTPVKEGDEQI